MLSVFTLLLSFFILASVRISSNSNLYVYLCILFFSIAFELDIFRSKKYRTYFLPLTAGYFARVILLYYAVDLNNPFHLPNISFSEDALRYFNAAVQYSKGYHISYGGFFSKILGTIFSQTGSSRLLAEFIVLLFSIATIMVLITILHELNISLFYKQVSVYLICFLPNYMLLSVALLRETMITFFLALSILYFIRWFNKSRGEIAFLLAIFFAFMGSMFHGAVGMIAAVYIIIRLVYSPIEHKYQLYYKNILYALMFLIVFTVSFRFLGGVIFKKVIDKIDKIDFEEVETIAEERGRGGSNYAKYVGDPSSPLKIAIYALPRYLYYMYSPFPWQWRGVVDILTFLFSSAVYLYILVKALLYIKKTSASDRYRNLLIALVGIALVMGEIFSWGVSNTGTATRHRDKFIALYMVMLALGSKIEKEPKSQQAANDASLTKL